MSNTIGIFLLGIVSAFEIWLLYQILFHTVIDSSHYGKKEKIIVWVSILFIGFSLGYNRELIFFSSLLFVMIMLFLIIIVWRLEKRNMGIISGIIVLYFTMIALLDYLWAFLSMVILDESFINRVHRGVSLEKIVIFALSRGLIFSLLLISKKRRTTFNSIIEYKRIIGYLDIVLFVVLIRYQFWMVDMVEFLKPIDGFGAGASILAIVCVILFFVYLIIKNMFYQKENEMLISKDEITSKLYQELLQGIEKNRQLTHDIKHHILILQEYEKQKDYEKLHDYLEMINGELLETQYPILTGNRIVDFILNQKRQVAENTGIRFEIDTTVFFSQPLEDKHVCVLLGNLLDNAIEAAGMANNDNPWIKVRLEKVQQMFFINVSNSYVNMPKIVDGEIITLKKDKEIHGYGLKSVKRIVEEHGGRISLKAKDNQFIVNISFFSEE